MAAPVVRIQSQTVAADASAENARHASDALMARLISVRFDDVSLKLAIDLVLAKVDAHATYRSAFIEKLDKPITLHAEKMPLGIALDAILQGTGLRAQAIAADLVKIEPTNQSINLGTVVGTVTDANTKRPVVGAMVSLDNARGSIQTNANGEYQITGVVAGSHGFRVRHLGYTVFSTTIAVRDDEAARLDVLLIPSATRLSEVVTTAIGNQRRLEVGNVIAHLNVDSIARTAPVNSLTDLLSGRAPGVQIIETNGLVGSGPTIRIRGQSSLLLQSDPIIIVDGVRQNNTSGAGFSELFQATARPSRINDLDFGQIETIDILKGPTASTEYGTDAANGVIVITTKQGRSGKPQWQLSGERAESTMPHTFQEYYTSWGHLQNGTQVNCPLTPGLTAAGVTSLTAPCTIDSLTHFNPLNHPTYSVYGTGDRERYTLAVSGGTPAVLYNIGGGFTTETGATHLPDIFRSRAIAFELPNKVFHPNTEEQHSLRANTQVQIGPTAQLHVQGAYLSTNMRGPGGQNLITGILNGQVLPDSAHNYGYGTTAYQLPLLQFGQYQIDRTTRTTGGLSADWQPRGWLTTHATTGVDHSANIAESLRYPQAGAAIGFPSDIAGILELYQTTTDMYSADGRASATAWVTSHLRSVTSVGSQLADAKMQGLKGNAWGISSINLSLNGVANPSITQLGDEHATLGGYAEEQLAFYDRVFVTGALRIDAGSGFGSDYNAVTYPKASVSWLAWNGQGHSLRLRGAFGESGVQPDNGAALQLYTAGLAYANGGQVSAVRLTTPGNPLLKPERSREIEGGVDIGLFDDRMNLELTRYRKLTKDALVNMNAGWDFNNLQFEENLGLVENHGTEATLTAAIARSSTLTWDIVCNLSTNKNRLVHLAPGASASIGGVNSYQRNAPGYPLYGYWGRTITYADANHNHIMEQSEVTVSDTETYVGSSLPTREASLSSQMGFLNNVVSLNILFDYRGGYRVYNSDAAYTDFFGTSQERVDENSSLWLQARGVGVTKARAINLAPFFEDGSFVRLRELSLTYLLPSYVMRFARGRDIRLTGAVRNLALWTHYTGPDPEVSSPGGGGFGNQFGTGLPYANDDLRSSFGAIPLARYWILRLNIGL